MLKRIAQPALLLPLMIVVITAIIFVFLILQRGNVSTKAIQEQAWRVAVIPAVAADYAPTVRLHGLTESPQNSKLEAAIEADVKKTLVYEGHHVEKGQLLIQLDDREVSYTLAQREADIKDLQAQILREKNRLKSDQLSLKHEQTVVNLAKAAVEREKQIFKKGLGSQSAIDEKENTLWLQSLILRKRKLDIENHPARLAELEAKLARAKAIVKRAQLDFSRSQIKAPFTGYISKLLVAVGSRVRPDETLIEMYDSTAIEVRAQIPSRYMATIHQAIRGKKTLNATATLDNQKIQLQLDRLASSTVRGHGGVDGLFKVTKSTGHVALGRSISVLLTLPTLKQVYAIPFSALYGDQRIYIVKDQRMKAINVSRLGILHHPNKPEEVIISSPELKEKDLMITTQLPNARDGLKVTINNHAK